MDPSHQPDIAALYHLASSNVRERTPDLSLNFDLQPRSYRNYPGAPRVVLPGRDLRIDVPLGELLDTRTSVREFAPVPLPLAVLGQLLRASAGIRGERQIEGRWTNERVYPSAGGLYPLEVYVATQAVEDLNDGVYHYDARADELEQIQTGVVHAQLAEMTIGQEMLRDAHFVLVITAIAERSMWKYGQRGYRYVWIEAGHLAQNLYLVGHALGLGTVTIGGFFDGEIDALLRLPSDERTVYLAAIGRPADLRAGEGRQVGAADSGSRTVSNGA
jgi:SagB-type dehydrogenase family enzyme